MKRAFAGLTALALLVVLAAPASATTTRYGYQCTEIPVAQPAAGDFWIQDGVAYLRGAVYEYATFGDEECAGTYTIIVNFNLDLTTSSGALWGTSVSELDAFDGGYTSSWNAHWTASDPLAPDATDIWAGQYVGHGYGQLQGWQARATIVEKTHILILDEGYAFHPGT